MAPLSSCRVGWGWGGKRSPGRLLSLHRADHPPESPRGMPGETTGWLAAPHFVYMIAYSPSFQNPIPFLSLICWCQLFPNEGLSTIVQLRDTQKEARRALAALPHTTRSSDWLLRPPSSGPPHPPSLTSIVTSSRKPTNPDHAPAPQCERLEDRNQVHCPVMALVQRSCPVI